MSEYKFRSEWHVAAEPDAVYQALSDVAAYPTWWPQVVGAQWLDDTSGEIRCRSMLPYELVFVAHRVIEDPVKRVLRANLDGDLTGTSQWTISANGSGTVAVFDEDVDVRNRLARLAGRLVRPALKYNHDRMMQSGEKGLQRLLEP
jgi:carbon monoxide dehydrogenase subunit G